MNTDQSTTKFVAYYRVSTVGQGESGLGLEAHRMAGLNLLAAIVIHWNTKQLGIAVAARLNEGKDRPDALLSHISPLGWAHILLTGEYRWRKQRP